MPADTLLWDEGACLDAIKVFVVAATAWRTRGASAWAGCGVL